MHSLLTTCFLNLKLQVSLEEALRTRNQTLDLRNHGLEECPNLLFTLPTEYLCALKCILLQSNLLDNFSRVNCHCLENLKALTLDRNKLTDLPFDFRRLTNLTILNVSHNSFHNLHFFYVICQLKNLRILWANATGIDEIPLEISELNKLRVLGLRHNRISIIPQELFSLRDLRWLTLANNFIREIPSEISKLSSLVHLNLGGNYLEDVPENFNSLLELQYLFLDHNSLFIDKNFNAFISSFPNLKYCSLRGNLSPSLPNPTRSFHMIRRNEGEVAQNLDSINRSNVGMSPSLDSLHSIGRTRSSVNNPTISHSSGREVQASPGNVAIFQPGENSGEWGDSRYIGANHLSEIEQEPQVSGGSFDHYVTYPESSATASVRRDDNESIEQRSIDQDQTLEIVFSRDENRRNNKEPNQVNDDEDPEKCSDETSENIAEYDLPFANTSITSVTAMPSFGKTRSRADPAFVHDDYENDNVCNNSSLQTFHRQSRTEQWILRQQSSQPCPYSFSDGSLPQRKSDGSNLTPLCQKNNSGENVLLQELVRGQVNDLIGEAAENVSVNNGNYCQVLTSASSTSLIYIMPPARRDPQPYCLNASASFTCNRGTVSSSVLITPSQDDVQEEVSRNEQRHLSNTRHASTGSQRSVNRTDSALFSVSVRRVNVQNGVPSIFLNDGDVDSNYDPTDWEHSAPSSAIDEQDIVTRFAELHDEIEEDHEEHQGFHQLNERDWRRILPLVFIL